MPVARAPESTHPRRAHTAPSPTANNRTATHRVFLNKPNQRPQHHNQTHQTHAFAPRSLLCRFHVAFSRFQIPPKTTIPTPPNTYIHPQPKTSFRPPIAYFQTNPTNPFPTTKTAFRLTPRTIKPNQTHTTLPLRALRALRGSSHLSFAHICGSLLLLHAQAFNTARPITTPVTLQGVF